MLTCYVLRGAHAMLIYKFSGTVIFVISLITFIGTPTIFPMKQSGESTAAKPGTPINPAPNQQKIDTALKCLEEARTHIADTILRASQALALAHSSNNTAIGSFELANKASALANNTVSGLEKVLAIQTNLEQQLPATLSNLEHKYDQLSQTLALEVKDAEERISAAATKEKALKLGDKIKIALETEKAKDELGINEKQARIKAQGKIDAGIASTQESWRNFRETISDSKLILKIAAALVILALCIYMIKYGLPALINYFSKPYVISETSKTGLLGWLISHKKQDLDDLIFVPALQKQLSNLMLRVQSAKQYGESLPNVLFCGASGTGKTAFAKALAYASGLDYALTSGSEFAKITDLKTANDELRKLLNWAKKSKGLIIFIDEAESLFANRKLSTTSKATQDFINTFLALISEQSQKDVMFIFATNHPSKIDDAIINRIGVNVEFSIPGPKERSQILFKYLTKFAQENEDATVELHPEISQMLSKYTDKLEDFSPRAIKFVAETMIINARRRESKQLTNEIAEAAIDEAKRSFQKTVTWKEESNKR